MVRGDAALAQQLKEEIATFLREELQLELSAEKTLITPVERGIEFLGFQIRKYQKATLITPSRKAVAKFKEQVRRRAWVGFSDNDAAGITFLNRYIIGWGQYYRRVSSTRAFRHLDNYVWWRVMRTTYRLRVGQGALTFAQHYRKHRIAYRFDINTKNRRRRGGHYGAWADSARKQAYIIVRLTFLPIVYIRLHPQLNPYRPEERAVLETQRALQALFADLQRNEPTVNREYGPEWQVARQRVLTDADYRCTRCGRSIQGRQAHVHHQLPLKHAKSRKQANLLEHLISLCPTCHAQIEREGRNGKERA